MKRLVLVLVPVLLLAASAGALAQGTPEGQAAATVFVRTDPELGPFLTDPKGMTLYLFTKDTTPGESNCYDQCAQSWPPFTASEPLTLPSGVSGELTTITRTDGTTQVAYNQIPLYYFAKDTQPGDTNGQGVGGVWFVVAPGEQFGTAAATPAAAPSEGAATPAAAGEVAVTLTEFTISSSATTFKVGETYTFTATNNGQFSHQMYIEKVGAVDEPLEANGQEAEIETMDAGASGTLTWTFTEAGLYQLACHVRDHYQKGMALTIEVVA
jgi:predicted lipoprotein with Yx(FWY)xxD motif/uncharacterized cupredoxin-like copper-binding protein